ncbi:MAG: LytR/AlgR family response regulator transcription factor [Lachnospiraceae bacterium]
MVKIAICDDGEIEQRILENLLRALFAKRKLECEITAYSCGEELLSEYEKGKYDLILLDIYMKQMNGIETGREIRKRDHEVDIIYCTSSADFALESYDVFAIGYLLKPFDKKKLDFLIGFFLQRKPRLKKNHITVLSKYQEKVLEFDHICYIESSDKVVMYHMDNQEDVTVYEQLGKVEKQLEDSRFFRCHQSYIVNFDFVITVDQDDFVLKGDSRVPIRKREKKKIVDQYRAYMDAN